MIFIHYHSFVRCAPRKLSTLLCNRYENFGPTARYTQKADVNAPKMKFILNNFAVLLRLCIASRLCLFFFVYFSSRNSRRARNISFCQLKISVISKFAFQNAEHLIVFIILSLISRTLLNAHMKSVHKIFTQKRTNSEEKKLFRA